MPSERWRRFAGRIHRRLCGVRLNEYRRLRRHSALAAWQRPSYDYAERLAGLGSWECDLETGRLDWSAHMFRLTRTDPRRWIPTLEEGFNVLARADRERLIALMRQGSPFSIDVRLFCEGEGVRWGSLAARRPHPDTAPGLFRGTLIDVTERKLDELMLIAAKEEADDLNHRLEAALEQSRNLAEAAQLASRVKTQFLSTISHELRTPLNGILGFACLLLDTPLSEEQEECVRTQIANSESLLELINGILEIARLESGESELQDNACDLIELLEEAFLDARRRRADLRLGLCVDAAVPEWIRTDPARLRRILACLLDNALKFTAEGAVSLRVEAAPVANEPEALNLSFELADTGSGFDQAEARRLFEDFTQGDATFTRRHGGSGLGLALARRLCRLLGGEISATGEKGRGACFTFSIRARRCRVAHGEPTPALAEGTCVLNAMDAGVDAEHLQAFLERWRLPVVRAGQSLPEGTRHAIVLLSLGSAEAMRARLEALADATAGRTAEYLAVSALGTSAEGAAYPEAITACLPMCRENLRLLLRNAGPRARVPQLREPSPEPAAPAPARTVLVVEDNPVNTRVAGLILSRLGHRILTASNGLEGIERLRDEPIDLVLMDLQMPVMDGLEATRRIREGEAGESRRNVPIVAVTTCLDFDNREKLVHAGLTDFIGKPLKPEYIRAAVGRYCLAEPSQSET